MSETPIVWYSAKDVVFNRMSSAGAGGFGTVHIGRHARYGKVALKRLGKWGDVPNEVEIWRGLSHVNVLSFLGILVEGESMYLVSPWVEHGSLPSYLLRNPDTDRISLLKGVAEGLAYLHDQEVVHGDVKGLNILISTSIQAMLCDFGLSKQIDYASGETQDAVGTWPWMSPERLQGGRRSFKDDVYAFGITVYEALSGRTPFSGYRSFPEIVRAVHVHRERPEQKPTTSTTGLSYTIIWELAALCWASEPNDRPPMKTVLAHKCFANMSLYSQQGEPEANAQQFPASLLTIADPFRKMDAPQFTDREGPSGFGESPADGMFDTLGPIGPEDTLHRSPPSAEMTQLRATFTQEQRSLLDRLNPVTQASYDSRRADAICTCMTGTRVQVLDDIDAWIKDDSLGASPVFWANGIAGVGKSTIAKTVAYRTQASGQLGASFFLSRRAADVRLRDPAAVIPTIAYQLAEFNDGYKTEVLKALEKRPSISELNLESQVRFFLEEVLPSVKRPGASPIVVLDAFDECEGPDASDLLHLMLAKLFGRPGLPLKLFITSRPEVLIQKVFQSFPKCAFLVLHNVEERIVEADIQLYLNTSLENIPHKLGLQESVTWFTSKQLAKLVHNSGKLFLYAATVLRFVSTDPPGDPQAQLNKVLASTSRSASVFADLDALYLEILAKIANSDADFVQEFRLLVGSVIMLRDFLSVTALENLLGYRPSKAKSLLRTVISLIIYPTEDSGNIKLYHPSFAEFIVDPALCTNPSLHIDTFTHERELAIRCMTAVINIGEAEIQHGSFSDDLQYSCKYWSSHLSKSPLADSRLLELLESFAKNHFLRWLELMALQKLVAVAIRALRDAELWALNSKCSSELTSALNDFWRFVAAFSEPINAGHHYIRQSALPFCPRNSQLWAMYGHWASIKLLNGSPSRWSPMLCTLSGHSGTVHTIAFSPDGTRLVSGSQDATLRVWDVVSGAELLLLEGHTAAVKTIMFSPDGTQLASGSGDRTVQLWDIISGARIALLEGHTGRIDTLAFSPDGIRLASGSEDNTARLWDLVSGATRVLRGHSAWVQTLAFSPDGTQIATGSKDRTVRLWAVPSGAGVALLESHTAGINTIVFSPNGTQLASSSYDNAVGLWDARSGTNLSMLRGHTDWVQTLSFSPDGTRLASGSKDQVVWLWDVTSGEGAPLPRLHTAGVSSLAFSPDGRQLASGSFDKTVGLWDIDSKSEVGLLEGHKHWVSALAFSPDGTRLASGSFDNTVRLWDVKSCVEKEPSQGHKGGVISLAVSPDRLRLASGSTDGTVLLWNTTTGAELTSLDGHTEGIKTLAFSPDGRQIATGSYDKTVRLWDIASGVEIAPPAGHKAPVNTLAFSPDGRRLASGSADKIARMWTLTTRRRFTYLRGHTDEILSLVFSLDGRRLATGSLDWKVYLWNVASGALVARLQGHTAGIKMLEFSPDGARLVSASFDNTVRLWDPVSGAEVMRFDCPYEGRSRITFSPDGLLVLRGSRSWVVPETHPVPGHSKWRSPTPKIDLHCYIDKGWLQVGKEGTEAVRVCHIPSERVRAVDFCHSLTAGNLVVIGGTNGRVLILNLMDLII